MPNVWPIYLHLGSFRCKYTIDWASGLVEHRKHHSTSRKKHDQEEKTDLRKITKKCYMVWRAWRNHGVIVLPPLKIEITVSRCCRVVVLLFSVGPFLQRSPESSFAFSKVSEYQKNVCFPVFSVTISWFIKYFSNSDSVFFMKMDPEQTPSLAQTILISPHNQWLNLHHPDPAQPWDLGNCTTLRRSQNSRTEKLMKSELCNVEQYWKSRQNVDVENA